MFKLHKPQMSGSIHSGHFMVSRLDDDEDDDNNDPTDDSSESERDNAQSVEIDIHNPDMVADAAKNLEIAYSVDSPSTKNEQVTSWNDLDRPPTKRLAKQNQYLTYYTNTSNTFNARENDSGSSSVAVQNGALDARLMSPALDDSTGPKNLVITNSVSSVTQQQQSLQHQQQTHSLQHNQQPNQQLNNNSIISNGFSITTNSSLAIAQTTAAVAATAGAGVSTTPVTSSASAAAALISEASRQLQLQQQRHQQQQPLSKTANQQHQQHQQLQMAAAAAAAAATRQHQHHQQMQLAAAAAVAHGQHAHQVTIDTSLTKLLQCMSLYYSSKLTSPKWKSFKGLKLRLKYKIRLNNLIWRAWFLQYIRGRRPPGCQFVAPAETDVHKKSETIVLEGKYWKRKEKAIVDEYKKWRIFNIHKQKNQLHCFRPSSFDWDNRVSNLSSGPEYQFYQEYDMTMNYNLDDLPPMLEDIEQQANYYQQSPIVQQQQQTSQQLQSAQQQQQQQQVQLQQHMINLVPSNQHQHPEEMINRQQQVHNYQVSRVASAGAAATCSPVTQHSQALSLKTGRPLSVGHQPQQQHQMIQNIQNFHQHHNQNTSTPLVLDNDLVYQQQQVTQASLQVQQQQQSNNSSQLQADRSMDHNDDDEDEDDDDQMMSMDQDLQMSSSSSTTSGRNEQRRVCHINAEQKRRCNIKNGFDTLRSILPSINQNINFKISKASMLQKAAVHIANLTVEQKQQAEERANIKQQIDALKQTISAYQAQLPASGSSASVQNTASSSVSRAREMLQDYIRRRTLENWKFWIFSLLIEPLFQSYYQTVNTNSLEDACKTIFTWLEQSCGLISLRKDVLESLTFLSTNTNILQTPHTLPTEAMDAVRYSPSNNNDTTSTTATTTTTSTSSSASANTSNNTNQQPIQIIVSNNNNSLQQTMSPGVAPSVPSPLGHATPASMAAAAAAASIAALSRQQPFQQQQQQQQQHQPHPHRHLHQHQQHQLQQQQHPHHHQHINHQPHHQHQQQVAAQLQQSPHIRAAAVQQQAQSFHGQQQQQQQQQQQAAAVQASLQQQIQQQTTANPPNVPQALAIRTLW